MKKVLSTEKAPQAIGPYSQGIDTGSLMFLSGQLPIVPSEGKIVAQDSCMGKHGRDRACGIV